MINEVDADGSGTIDFPEFLTFLARKTVDLDSKEQNIKEQIFEVFSVDPKSHEPLINSSDLIDILEELNEPFEKEEIENLLKESSINGDKKDNKMAIGIRGICMFWNFKTNLLLILKSKFFYLDCRVGINA